jgi:hypothetical protein
MLTKYDSRRYIIVFFITLAIFLTAAALSNFFSNKKVEQVKKIQDKMSIDILSIETQFQLLQELSCRDVKESTLSSELNDLAEKISYSEENLKNKKEVSEMKRYYSLLQIKDYLLSQKLKEKCKLPVESIFYFYTTAENCTECVKQGLVLTELRESYPDLRIYSFDFSTNLSALDSLKKIFKISDTKLPAIIINDEVYTGFKKLDDLEKLLPESILGAKKQKDIDLQNESNNKNILDSTQN